jgi:hypothetical protein
VKVFENCPLHILFTAMENLFPEAKFKAYYGMEDELGEHPSAVVWEGEEGEGEAFIMVSVMLSIVDVAEQFAHCLAHVVCKNGNEDHSEVWNNTYYLIHSEASRISKELENEKVLVENH